MITVRHIVFLICLLLCLPTLADTSRATAGTTQQLTCSATDANCRAINSWELSVALGLGARSNPVIDSDAQPLVLIPHWSWYGERFFVDNLDAGYTLWENRAHMFNLLVTANLDEFFFEDDVGLGNFVLEQGSNASPNNMADPDSNNVLVTRDGLNERRLSVLGGLDYSYFHNNFLLNLQLLGDVSGVHDGQEARIAIGYDLPARKNRYSLSLGMAWQSRELLDYYYGLDRNEVEGGKLLYEPDAGVSPFVQLSWERQISRRWSLYSSLRYRLLSGEITDSPLVEDDYVTTVFLGGEYHF